MFLQTKFVGQRRFSLEGAEALIPLIDTVLTEAAEAHLDEAVVGMAHRGRLNVLANTDTDSVVVTGEGADSVPADHTNLASRAAEALAQAVGPGCKDSPGLTIRISKRIPVAAGLAGGSADAAATLVACNELWRTGLSQAELCELAAGIGSDVAFGLVGGTAIGVGRGERVTPALAAGTYHWVLAFATGGLSTAQVYAACDRIRAGRGGPGTAGAPAPAMESARPNGRTAAMIPRTALGDPSARSICGSPSAARFVLSGVSGTAQDRRESARGGVQETYIQGVSTRSVDELVKAMGMTGISKCQVSRLCAEIDERVNAFLMRPLEGDWPYLWIAARNSPARSFRRLRRALVSARTVRRRATEPSSR